MPGQNSAGAEGKITFLADGNGDFARALGLSLDLTARGLGIRSQRYAMLVDNGVVQTTQPGNGTGQSRDLERGSPAETALNPFRVIAVYGGVWCPILSVARPRPSHVTETNAPSHEPVAANRT